MHAASAPGSERARADDPVAPPRVLVEADLGTFACDVWPGGPSVVLLLHGLPGERASTRRLARILGPARTVVAPDLLGFGDSTARSPRAPHAREQAVALLSVLDHPALRTHPGPVDIVGFDFGGPTALWLLRLAPHRFRSLTLVAANVFADTPVPRPLRALAVPGLGALVARLMLSRLGLLAMWRGAVADRRALGWRRFWASAGASSTRRASREILRASLLDLAGLYRPVQETLSSLSLPVLVAWGVDDPFFPPGQPRRTASAVPGARLLVLPGCGHFVAEERPRELARAMEELWRQCPGPS